MRDRRHCESASAQESDIRPASRGYAGFAAREIRIRLGTAVLQLAINAFARSPSRGWFAAKKLRLRSGASVQARRDGIRPLPRANASSALAGP
ncbi:hypothetical protein SBBP2_1480006 [Burkholderiales bacterium]|nr:hypothetical protein SBBP2_1480006 [Burkholderiales bacterium]